MSERQLSLPEDVYQGLLAAAAMEGATPVGWITAHVSQVSVMSTQQHSLYDLLADLAGAIDDDEEPHQPPIKDVVAEAITTKLANKVSASRDSG